jgi:SpoVK/Ycf46/Vps4 family AAA+-type ATPase
MSRSQAPKRPRVGWTGGVDARSIPRDAAGVVILVSVARGDLLIHLVRAARERDEGELRRTVESMIAEEREKQHHLLAERLEEALRTAGPVENGGRQEAATTGFAILTPRRRLDDLVLPEAVRSAVEELIEEQQRSEVLRAHGLEPRHRVLLTGPPGNGKTSLGESIAEALLLPLLVVRYEEVIGSYLGETASRLAAVFAFGRTRRCVVFFDEFDAVAKERGDEHETGEIKRVVSSLLMQVDALPSHAVVVAASNHPELLDRAVHRRFQLRLELPMPGKVARMAWFERLFSDLGEPVGLSAETLARRTTGASFSQLQDLADDIHRRRVLEPGTSLRRLVPERLRRWREVSALEAHA